MIRSMTAFAAAKTETEWGQLSIELRSLNHRYLELFMRLPEELRVAEPQVREALSERLSRGKVDCTVRFKRDPGAAGARLQLNEQLAAQISELAQQASSLLPEARPSSLAEWLRWPGLVSEAEPDLSPLGNALTELVERASADMVAFREREGEKLATLITDRLAQVREQVAAVREWLPEIRGNQRTRMDEKVSQLSTSLDPERLEQEVAILLQKLDVDEELDRLEAHITEVERTLALTKPVGRRLDFLMQELHREANTLGSKSVDSRTTQASVNLKVLIEQMREQVQNIE
jgi:uncharacterized protein (TIGR00255 family)